MFCIFSKVRDVELIDSVEFYVAKLFMNDVNLKRFIEHLRPFYIIVLLLLKLNVLFYNSGIEKDREREKSKDFNRSFEKLKNIFKSRPSVLDLDEGVVNENGTSLSFIFKV